MVAKMVVHWADHSVGKSAEQTAATMVGNLAVTKAAYLVVMSAGQSAGCWVARSVER